MVLILIQLGQKIQKAAKKQCKNGIFEFCLSDHWKHPITLLITDHFQIWSSELNCKIFHKEIKSYLLPAITGKITFYLLNLPQGVKIFHLDSDRNESLFPWQQTEMNEIVFILLF